MEDYVPTPLTNSLPLESLEDAAAICEDTVKRIRSGEIADPKQAETILKGVATFCNAYTAKLKHSPKQIALEEAARTAARRAAEKIDLKKATEILQSRNFKPLEDYAGVIDVKAEEKKAEEVIKIVTDETRKLPVRSRTEIF